MSEIPNQRSILGLVILFLILGGQNRGAGTLSSLGKNLQLERFAKDMHRMVAMMDQVENLTQMAGIGQLVSAASGAYSSPASSSHIGGASNAVSGALADTFASLSSQDLSQLMELAGPVMEMLGSGTQKK